MPIGVAPLPVCAQQLTNPFIYIEIKWERKCDIWTCVHLLFREAKKRKRPLNTIGILLSLRRQPLLTILTEQGLFKPDTFHPLHKNIICSTWSWTHRPKAICSGLEKTRNTSPSSNESLGTECSGVEEPSACFCAMGSRFKPRPNKLSPKLASSSPRQASHYKTGQWSWEPLVSLSKELKLTINLVLTVSLWHSTDNPWVLHPETDPRELGSGTDKTFALFLQNQSLSPDCWSLDPRGHDWK